MSIKKPSPNIIQVPSADGEGDGFGTAPAGQPSPANRGQSMSRYGKGANIHFGPHSGVKDSFQSIVAGHKNVPRNGEMT